MKKFLTICFILSGFISYSQEYEGNYVHPAASGGVPPYTYNMDGGPYQTLDTFIVSPGSHVINIKDNVGCIKTMSFTMYGTLSITMVTKTITSLTVAASGGKPPYSFSKNSTTNYYANRTLWTGLTKNVTYVMRVKDALNYVSSVTIKL